jgi:hypothetical protein
MVFNRQEPERPPLSILRRSAGRGRAFCLVFIYPLPSARVFLLKKGKSIDEQQTATPGGIFTGPGYPDRIPGGLHTGTGKNGPPGK